MRYSLKFINNINAAGLFRSCQVASTIRPYQVARNTTKAVHDKLRRRCASLDQDAIKKLIEPRNNSVRVIAVRLF
jgi:hypothetical protein